jgi:hypothetical protein
MAQDGKCSAKGEPLFMQLIVMLTGFQFKGYRTDMPLLLQKVMPPLLTPIARMLGYRAIYQNHSGFER